jgi:choline dehydrogenase-like flavoprotein
MVERSFDVVIVGAGAGGGTVAKELAPLCREGVRIAVLEWGPKLKGRSSPAARPRWRRSSTSTTEAFLPATAP